MTSTSSYNEWLRPPCRTDIIETLISSVDRYNPNNVGLLEDYLLQQLKEDQYDCLSNLAILKLYQFNPELSTPEVIINILLKALAHAPFGTDFNLAMAMLGDRMSPATNRAPTLAVYSLLARLSSLLLTRRFTQFWSSLKDKSTESKQLAEFIEEIIDWEIRIRKSIADEIGKCFGRVGKSRAAVMLGFKEEDPEFKSFISSQGWALEQDGSAIRIPPNPWNTPKSAAVSHEDIQVEQLARLLTPKA